MAFCRDKHIAGDIVFYTSSILVTQNIETDMHEQNK